MRPAWLVLMTFLAVPVVFGQSGETASPAASTGTPGGLAILTQMSQRYANAGSWYLQATEEQTSGNEYGHNWSKMVMVSAVSGNKYHYESHEQGGSGFEVSDGKTAWELRVEARQYTQKPAPANGYQQPKTWVMGEGDVYRAVAMKKVLAGFSSQFTTATRLQDETIFQDGMAVACYVVRVSSDQRKGPKVEGFSSEETLWIDKATWTVRKTVEHQNTFLFAGGARIPLVMDTVTVYEKAELNSAVPEALFRFEPPADAKLVAKFNPRIGADLTGEMAPDVQVADANGSKVSLASVRGKPVLLDFWATWCAPCVASLPKLAEINREGASKGLVVLSVDEDEEAKTAADFLAAHKYSWPNSHDDGKIAGAFKETGIPLLVLIDAQGKIVFYESGEDEIGLRKALAGLGPEFASLAQEQSPGPCKAGSK